MIYISADFETINDENDCRVWAAGAYDIYMEDFWYTNSIDKFMQKLFAMAADNPITVSFHNLKFDGSFVLDWLFRSGYEYSELRVLKEGQFSALISDMGTWYQVKINAGGNIITLVNSLNLLNFSLHDIAISFGLEEKKGRINYNKKREKEYEPDDSEIGYLKNDCVIAGKAWRYFLDNGHNKITAGSNALQYYKKTISDKDFKYWFPGLSKSEDKFIRKAYRGGWVYANPKFRGKEIGGGKVYDVTSLYPSRMRYCPMPTGKGVWFDGQYRDDPDHPLYVQRLECAFKLKPGKFPMVQIKNNVSFLPTQYVTATDGEAVEITLANPDLDLFFECYDVDPRTLVYTGGYKYRSAMGMFDRYIDNLIAEKEEASRRGDKPKRSLAKLFMNGLYGKFSKRPTASHKIPMWDGKLYFEPSSLEDQKTLYLPVGIFTTAWGRAKTIRGAIDNAEIFLYADTDSLHLIGDSYKNLNVGDKLGEWKIEGGFLRAKYLGAKCYCEEMKTEKSKIIEFLRENGECYHLANVSRETLLQITCAGMTPSVKRFVNFENFEEGAEYAGKLAQKRVAGGTILYETTFSIKTKNILTKKEK